MARKVRNQYPSSIYHVGKVTGKKEQREHFIIDTFPF
jgi:hypothetical protein